MINYPIKKEFNNNKATNKASMGMALEEMIIRSNTYYSLTNVCYVNKRPTPIKVIKSENYYKVKEGYFEASSTLDFVGVYKGKYLDFEAKETLNKKSFPLSNIATHQIEAMKQVITNGGISFAIILFKSINEIYFLDAKYIINYEGKSLPLEYIKENGHLIKEGYNIPVDYIKIIKEFY